MYRRLSGKVLPLPPPHRPALASAPNQLPWVGDHDCGSLFTTNRSSTRLNGFDEINSGSGIDAFVSANGAVSEDAEVLVAFAEIDDQPFGADEVGGDEDGDVRVGFLAVEREAKSL